MSSLADDGPCGPRPSLIRTFLRGGRTYSAGGTTVHPVPDHANHVISTPVAGFQARSCRVARFRFTF